jgi:hypothetical protein
MVGLSSSGGNPALDARAHRNGNAQESNALAGVRGRSTVSRIWPASTLPGAFGFTVRFGPVCSCQLGLDFWLALDAGAWHRYDPRMLEHQRAERPRPTSDDAECNDAERERFIAAVEAGLADVAAGRVYSHAEVLAEMRRRFPWSPK